MKEYQNRIQSFVEVKNRTMHLGNTKYVYDPSIGKNTDRAILDSDGDHTIDYADDPLSYVKHISQSIFDSCNIMMLTTKYAFSVQMN